MLHDPRWNHGTLAGLIAWLEGQQPETSYRYFCCQTCLISRYMDGIPKEKWPEEMRQIYHGEDKFRIACGDGSVTSHNYGAALQRAYEARQAVAA